MSRQATIRVPGSCGELVQGSIAGQDFLVSCPINLYSQVTVELSSLYQGIKVNRYAPRLVEAVQKTLIYLKQDGLGARVKIESDLLVGKGMASSTADITAATAGVMLALDYPIDNQLIKEIALGIEPTDSIFLPGLQLFDHREGKLARYLGEAPLLDILIFTEMGKVDSTIFNQREDLGFLNYSKEGLVRQALNLIEKGIKKNKPELIGEGASLSSKAHQDILYKKGLEQLLGLIRGENGIYGVNIAHSGTLMGVLVNKQYPEEKLISIISREIPYLKYIRRAAIISGGIEGSR
ncbi:GHMP kinase [Halocella sp. SP3-1]|uniref:GHMP family kinase ATP-binding protein n=1 Tax=Halocella sp. SP3-1 TaxID=2382161 RepID=UPI000F75691D|nr:GHMP kinase [Halocella sp. SP3-1]AZO95917.1 GHMP kinase [Halocella sp. SP3-1]